MVAEGELRAAVIGAGQMGHGIALVFALGGVPVALHDSAPGAAERALERIAANLAALVRAGRLSAAQADAAQALVRPADLADAVAAAGFVIEAIVEDLAAKRALFARLEPLVAAETILATNTSYLRITDIGAGLQQPERLVGSHFFLPADVVPLVEVVRGDRTDPRVAEATVALWRRLGKLPILVRRDIQGFVANRLQQAITREALELVQAGVVSAGDLDLAVRAGFGFRYPISGVLEQRDLAGWDLHLGAARRVYPTLANRTEPSALLERLVADGDLGLRSGRGLYDWVGADPEAVRRRRHAQALALLELVRPWLDAPREGRERDPAE